MRTLASFFLEHFAILFSFLLGAFFTIIYTRFQEKKKSKNLRNLYLTWYRLSKENILNQVKHLKEYISAIDKDLLGTTTLILSNVRIAELQSLKNDEIFQAFVLDHKGKKEKHAKDIFELTGHVQYLVTSIFEIKSKFENTQLNYKQWQSQWNDEIINFNQALLEYCLEFQNDRNDNYVDQIVEIKDEFTGKEAINRETGEIILNFIKPIEKLIQSHMQYAGNNGILKAVLTSAQMLQILEEEKQVLKRSTIRIISHYIDTINHTLQAAEKNVLYFSKSV